MNKKTKGPKLRRWRIYIPEEGHWNIPGEHRLKQSAISAYLKWAGRKSLPKGSIVDPLPEHEYKKQP